MGAVMLSDEKAGFKQGGWAKDGMAGRPLPFSWGALLQPGC